MKFSIVPSVSAEIKQDRLWCFRIIIHDAVVLSRLFQISAGVQFPSALERHMDQSLSPVSCFSLIRSFCFSVLPAWNYHNYGVTHKRSPWIKVGITKCKNFDFQVLTFQHGGGFDCIPFASASTLTELYVMASE